MSNNTGNPEWSADKSSNAWIIFGFACMMIFFMYIIFLQNRHGAKSTPAVAETKTEEITGIYTITELVPGEIIVISVIKLHHLNEDPRPFLRQGIQEVSKGYIIKNWLTEGFNYPGYSAEDSRLSSILLLVEPRAKQNANGVNVPALQKRIAGITGTNTN